MPGAGPFRFSKRYVVPFPVFPRASTIQPEAVAAAVAASTPALEDDRDRIEAVRAWAGGAATLPFDARLKLVALQLEFYADAEPLDPRVRTVLDALDAAWS